MIDLFFLILFLSLLFLAGLSGWTVANRERQRTGKRFELAPERHNKKEIDEELEIDIRLTYKRFKELYPYSKITYEEYKKLQAKKAFKRAVGSEKIKRMVR